MKNYDFLILGAGIFGLSTAIELRKQKFTVAVLNPGEIPHPHAASTDISKVIRMEYGTDVEYLRMAAQSMEGWRDWNDLFGEEIYHEEGYLMLSRQTDTESYERISYKNVQEQGFQSTLLGSEAIIEKFPAFAPGVYEEGFHHTIGGYAESGRALEVLATYARQLEVDIFEGQTADQIIIEQNRVNSVTVKEGNTYSPGHVIVCAGNNTPYLLADLKPYMRITGHPVFHLKPSQPELFKAPHFSVFTADIAKTGWYGFPLHPKEAVVKIANHGEGLELHPEEDEREVYPDDEAQLRTFLRKSIPALANDPIVYTRRCCYTDTLDGHFWIDVHPNIAELTVGSGGSGHGFKMGPEVGKMIAAKAVGAEHQWSDRYNWRELKADTIQEEEARFIKR